jgi:hypothetical protein
MHEKIKRRINLGNACYNLAESLLPSHLLSRKIIRQIKSRRMKWAGHVACMGEERKLYRDRVLG